LDIASRIKSVRGKLSQEEFALRLGVHKNSLGRYERGDSTPDMAFAEALCSEFCVNPHWLLLGKGPMFTTKQVRVDGAEAGSLRAGGQIATYRALPDEQQPEPGVVLVDDILLPEPEMVLVDNILPPEPGLMLVPMVEARLSAGQGSFETDGTIEKHYAFRSDFLRRKGKVEEMVLMRVEGDSMTPEIKHGDVVLIDQSQRRLLAGRIYAVGVEDVVYLKITNTAPGKVILSSFNRDYRPLEIDTRGDLESNVRIIGRCIWVCREL
jgi:transcriptional regulator with XRE-family HTH domain